MRRCPFINNLAIDAEVECVYLIGRKCDDIEVAPGNGDAWCTQKIQEAIQLDDKHDRLNGEE